MTVIVCTDERLGLSFRGKRQSRDRALTQDAVKSAGAKRILAAHYSKILFDEAGIDTDGGGVLFFDDPLACAEDGDAVFLEGDFDSRAMRADEIIIYSWNRHYPADRHLNTAALGECFDLCDTFEFVGNSHEKLTRYTLKHK